MKGPASINRFADQSLRDYDLAIRVVLTTTHLTENVDHWVRIKNVSSDWTNTALMLDYFEIVPKGVLTDPTNPEDKF